MRDPALNFKNFKQRGEWVEMLFMARAAREGLQVSKPYGESASYDFIVESGSLCSRIQVKSTLTRTHNGFVCNLRCSASRTYDLGSFDFAAVHVIPLEVWFIIPRLTKVGIFLRPGKLKAKASTAAGKSRNYPLTWKSGASAPRKWSKDQGAL